MEERLIKILSQMKSIKPDEGFVSRSRQNILSTPQKAMGGFRFRVFESFKLGAALALASALVFVLFGGLGKFQKNLAPALMSSINKENIQKEADGLDFQIQIGEATYKIGQQKEIGVEIDKLLKNLSL